MNSIKSLARVVSPSRERNLRLFKEFVWQIRPFSSSRTIYSYKRIKKPGSTEAMAVVKKDHKKKNQQLNGLEANQLYLKEDDNQFYNNKMLTDKNNNDSNNKSINDRKELKIANEGQSFQCTQQFKDHTDKASQKTHSDVWNEIDWKVKNNKQEMTVRKLEGIDAKTASHLQGIRKREFKSLQPFKAVSKEDRNPKSDEIVSREKTQQNASTRKWFVETSNTNPEVRSRYSIGTPVTKFADDLMQVIPKNSKYKFRDLKDSPKLTSLMFKEDNNNEEPDDPVCDSQKMEKIVDQEIHFREKTLKPLFPIDKKVDKIDYKPKQVEQRSHPIHLRLDLLDPNSLPGLKVKQKDDEGIKNQIKSYKGTDDHGLLESKKFKDNRPHDTKSTYDKTKSLSLNVPLDLKSAKLSAQSESVFSDNSQIKKVLSDFIFQDEKSEKAAESALQAPQKDSLDNNFEEKSANPSQEENIQMTLTKQTENISSLAPSHFGKEEKTETSPDLVKLKQLFKNYKVPNYQRSNNSMSSDKSDSLHEKEMDASGNEYLLTASEQKQRVDKFKKILNDYRVKKEEETSNSYIFGSHPSSKNNLNAELSAVPNAEINVVANAEINVVPNTELNNVPNAELNIVPNAGQKVVPNAELNVVPNAGQKVVPNAELNVVPNAGQKVVPNAGQKVVPNAELNVVPNAELNVAPNVELNVAPNTELNIVPNAGLNIVPNAGLNIVPNAGLKDVPNAGLNVVPNAVPNAVINVVPNAKLNVVPNAKLNVVPNAKLNVVPNAKLNVVPNAKLNVVPNAKLNVVPNAKLNVVPNAKLNVVPSSEVNMVPNEPNSEVKFGAGREPATMKTAKATKFKSINKVSNIGLKFLKKSHKPVFETFKFDMLKSYKMLRNEEVKRPKEMVSFKSKQPNVNEFGHSVKQDNRTTPKGILQNSKSSSSVNLGTRSCNKSIQYKRICKWEQIPILDDSLEPIPQEFTKIRLLKKALKFLNSKKRLYPAEEKTLIQLSEKKFSKFFQNAKARLTSGNFDLDLKCMTEASKKAENFSENYVNRDKYFGEGASGKFGEDKANCPEKDLMTFVHTYKNFGHLFLDRACCCGALVDDDNRAIITFGAGGLFKSEVEEKSPKKAKKAKKAHLKLSKIKKPPKANKNQSTANKNKSRKKKSSKSKNQMKKKDNQSDKGVNIRELTNDLKKHLMDGAITLRGSMFNYVKTKGVESFKKTLAKLENLKKMSILPSKPQNVEEIKQFEEIAKFRENIFHNSHKIENSVNEVKELSDIGILSENLFHKMHETRVESREPSANTEIHDILEEFRPTKVLKECFQKSNGFHIPIEKKEIASDSSLTMENFTTGSSTFLMDKTKKFAESEEVVPNSNVYEKCQVSKPSEFSDVTDRDRVVPIISRVASKKEKKQHFKDNYSEEKADTKLDELDNHRSNSLDIKDVTKGSEDSSEQFLQPFSLDIKKNPMNKQDLNRDEKHIESIALDPKISLGESNTVLGRNDSGENLMKSFIEKSVNAEKFNFTFNEADEPQIDRELWLDIAKEKDLMEDLSRTKGIFDNNDPESLRVNDFGIAEISNIVSESTSGMANKRTVVTPKPNETFVQNTAVTVKSKPVNQFTVESENETMKSIDASFQSFENKIKEQDSISNNLNYGQMEKKNIQSFNKPQNDRIKSKFTIGPDNIRQNDEINSTGTIDHDRETHRISSLDKKYTNQHCTSKSYGREKLLKEKLNVSKDRDRSDKSYSSEKPLEIKTTRSVRSEKPLEINSTRSVKSEKPLEINTTRSVRSKIHQLENFENYKFDHTSDMSDTLKFTSPSSPSAQVPSNKPNSKTEKRHNFKYDNNNKIIRQIRKEPCRDHEGIIILYNVRTEANYQLQELKEIPKEEIFGSDEMPKEIVSIQHEAGLQDELFSSNQEVSNKDSGFGSSLKSQEPFRAKGSMVHKQCSSKADLMEQLKKIQKKKSSKPSSSYSCKKSYYKFETIRETSPEGYLDDNHKLNKSNEIPNQKTWNENLITKENNSKKKICRSQDIRGNPVKTSFSDSEQRWECPSKKELNSEINDGGANQNLLNNPSDLKKSFDSVDTNNFNLINTDKNPKYTRKANVPFVNGASLLEFKEYLTRSSQRLNNNDGKTSFRNILVSYNCPKHFHTESIDATKVDESSYVACAVPSADQNQLSRPSNTDLHKTSERSSRSESCLSLKDSIPSEISETIFYDAKDYGYVHNIVISEEIGTLPMRDDSKTFDIKPRMDDSGEITNDDDEGIKENSFENIRTHNIDLDSDKASYNENFSEEFLAAEAMVEKLKCSNLSESSLQSTDSPYAEINLEDSSLETVSSKPSLDYKSWVPELLDGNNELEIVKVHNELFDVEASDNSCASSTYPIIINMEMPTNSNINEALQKQKIQNSYNNGKESNNKDDGIINFLTHFDTIERKCKQKSKKVSKTLQEILGLPEDDRKVYREILEIDGATMDQNENENNQDKDHFLMSDSDDSDDLVEEKRKMVHRRKMDKMITTFHQISNKISKDDAATKALYGRFAYRPLGKLNPSFKKDIKFYRNSSESKEVLSTPMQMKETLLKDMKFPGSVLSFSDLKISNSLQNQEDVSVSEHHNIPFPGEFDFPGKALCDLKDMINSKNVPLVLQAINQQDLSDIPIIFSNDSYRELKQTPFSSKALRSSNHRLTEMFTKRVDLRPLPKMDWHCKKEIVIYLATAFECLQIAMSSPTNIQLSQNAVSLTNADCMKALILIEDEVQKLLPRLRTSSKFMTLEKLLAINENIRLVFLFLCGKNTYVEYIKAGKNGDIELIPSVNNNFQENKRIWYSINLNDMASMGQGLLKMNSNKALGSNLKTPNSSHYDKTLTANLLKEITDRLDQEDFKDQEKHLQFDTEALNSFDHLINTRRDKSKDSTFDKRKETWKKNCNETNLFNNCYENLDFDHARTSQNIDKPVNLFMMNMEPNVAIKSIDSSDSLSKCTAPIEHYNMANEDIKSKNVACKESATVVRTLYDFDSHINESNIRLSGNNLMNEIRTLSTGQTKQSSKGSSDDSSFLNVSTDGTWINKKIFNKQLSQEVENMVKTNGSDNESFATNPIPTNLIDYYPSEIDSDFSCDEERKTNSDDFGSSTCYETCSETNIHEVFLQTATTTRRLY